MAQPFTEARVILDADSQRSYITHRMKDVLSLPAERKQRMSIRAFGSTDDGVQECDVVNICMKTEDGGMLELTLFTVPLICKPLAN